MNRVRGIAGVGAVSIFLCAAFGAGAGHSGAAGVEVKQGSFTVHSTASFDVSEPLAALAAGSANTDRPDCGNHSCGNSPADADLDQQRDTSPAPAAPVITPAGAAVEQTSPGAGPAPALGDSFDGLGEGFKGPQSLNGTAPPFRNPSDNSLAVGPDEIVQIVNSQFAVFSKKGAKHDSSGAVLYGPVPTNTIFSGFGGVCEARNNGDAVVRYDQLAGRWLVVMPIFSRIAPGEFENRADAKASGTAARPGQASNPGAPTAPPSKLPEPQGTYAMCYAVSVGSDPLGAYYRYAFERDLFPDYPRPAIWPDGYYVPTSTGDTVIQKHVCIADRTRMLAGQPATEQCKIIDGVNFLNNADIDGRAVPPAGAPNIMMAAGGTQLHNVFEDDGIYYWKVHVDWKLPAKTSVTGPVKIPVAPYHYLCDGQLTNCVSQPGTDRRLDAQGDKIMQRLVYRRIGDHESIVAAHSVATQAGGGGVRWYEFRLDKGRNPALYQQGTYAPGGFYRWMPSIAMDKQGDIGVGYSFGGAPNFAGQRFAARLAGDPLGQMALQESVLATGEAAQTGTLRWEDYTTTAIDPSDDCTFWYVGDYLKSGATSYSTRISSIQLPGCSEKH